jgi:hypothetical protein
MSMRMLMQNPYPVGGEIRLAPAGEGLAMLRIYTVTGARIRSLSPAMLAGSWHATSWDGRSDSGIEVSSGVYYLQTTIGEHRRRHSFVLVK